MIDPFKSEEERFFYNMSRSFPDLVESLNGWKLEKVMYEGITLNVGTVKYTPDFNLVLTPKQDLGDLLRLFVMVEVKGSKKQRGYTLTRSKLVQAASLFPEFVFVEVLVDGKLKMFKGFEVIDPKKQMIFTGG